MTQTRPPSVQLGNYVLLEKLGQGGMGEVYKARHRRMDRIVAVKLLSAAALRSEELVRRFQREVRAAARLCHPGIVTAYDADEAEGRHFLVMEYVDGADLATLVRQAGPLPAPEAVECLRQAAAGLEYAHAQGVIHRDLKPSNLLLDRSGTVKLLDLGLARLDEPADNDTVAAASLTGSGQVMGTADYMSPEQAGDCRTVDRRTDIYALGCTLFFLLTGRPPYHGPSWLDTIVAHRSQPIPSLRDSLPDVPPGLDAVYQRMLAKKPEERYESMQAVRSALATSGVGTEGAAARLAARLAELLAARGSLVPSQAGAESEARRQDLTPPVVPVAALPAAARAPQRRSPAVRLVIAGLAACALIAFGVSVLRDTSERPAPGGAKRVAEVSPSAASVSPSAGGVSPSAAGVSPSAAGVSPSAAHDVVPSRGESASPTDASSPATTDPDRRAAQWVLAIGGRLEVLVDEQKLSIQSLEQVPRTRFQIVSAGLGDVPGVDDQGLANLADLAGLGELALWNTSVSDAGLSNLRGLPRLHALYLSGTSVAGPGLARFQNLTWLELNGCPIDDEGARVLQGLTRLECLYLDGTRMGDTTLQLLAGLKSLKELHVANTRVTAAGIAALHAARPACRVISQ
jgi:tRNA A-37 threonylcarbamoyl transferase component Bud32/uncharacterized protein YjhX (UPF0386 family)